jgi:hypothetical protein
MGAVTDLLDNGSAVGDSIQKASRPDSAQGVQHGPVLRQLHSGGTGREATGHARWFERLLAELKFAAADDMVLYPTA